MSAGSAFALTPIESATFAYQLADFKTIGTLLGFKVFQLLLEFF